MKLQRQAIAAAAFAVLLSGGVVAAPARKSARKPAPAPVAKAPTSPRVSLEEARMTAAMLDDACQTLLHTIHDWYPTKTGQPIVAATIMRKVQEQVNTRGFPEARFVGVNGILMNPNHLARDPFERRAREALRRGDREYSAVENGDYRVATVIPLGGGCFSCHWSDQGVDSRAALTFRFPLLQEEASKANRAPRAKR